MPGILYASTVPAALEAFLLPYADHFRRLGWQVDAAAASGTSSRLCRAHFDRVWDVDWSRNPLDVMRVRAAVAQVRSIVAAGRYDIVHVHTPVAAFIARYALRREHRVRRVYTAHGFHFHSGGDPLRNAVYRELERRAGQWTDLLITINREDAAAALRYGIVTPERLAYVPGVGMDRAKYSPGAVTGAEVARVRTELGLRGSQPMFLMVAEFNPGKRHADALRAYARIAGESDAVLALAGRGPGERATRALAETLGISGRVRFLGLREDVPALMRAASALLLPSTREGLSRSVQEAQALGTAVIATDIRGIRDIVGDGRGLLVRVGDVTGLAEAMRFVLNNPAEVRAMVLRGLEHATRYDLGRILTTHEDLYAQVLGGALCTAAA